MLEQEIIHCFGLTKEKKGQPITKVDFSKAYDRLKWDILL